jgi:hypothetical protein
LLIVACQLVTEEECAHVNMAWSPHGCCCVLSVLLLLLLLLLLCAA